MTVTMFPFTLASCQGEQQDATPRALHPCALRKGRRVLWVVRVQRGSYWAAPVMPAMHNAPLKVVQRDPLMPVAAKSEVKCYGKQKRIVESLLVVEADVGFPRATILPAEQKTIAKRIARARTWTAQHMGAAEAKKDAVGPLCTLQEVSILAGAHLPCLQVDAADAPSKGKKVLKVLLSGACINIRGTVPGF